MALEILLPNGDDNGWPTGDWLDIDEGIASADGSILATTTDNDVVDIDLDDSARVDGDTINSITIKIHGRTNGSGTDSFFVDLLIGGVVQGTQQQSASLTGSMVTYTFNDVGWDVDWTAAQLDGMQVRVTANQSGMPTTVGHEIDAIDVEVDYTVAGGIFDLNQQSFRARNDDGTEITATWKFNEDENWIQAVDTNFRARTLIQESGTGTEGGTVGGQWQYRKNGVSWINITTSSSNVKAVASPEITDGVATTQQMGSGTFVAGSITETGNHSDITLSGDDETEVEGVFQLVGADLAFEDILELRCIGKDDDTTVFDTYTSIPKILPEDVLNEDFATSPGWQSFGSGSILPDTRTQDGGLVEVHTSGGGDGYSRDFGGGNTGAPVAVKEAWCQFEITITHNSGLADGDNLTGTGFALTGESNNRLGFGVGNFGGTVKYSVHPQENGGGRDIGIDTVAFDDGVMQVVTMHQKMATGVAANNGIVEVWIGDTFIGEASFTDDNSNELFIDNFIAGTMNSTEPNDSYDINIDVDNVIVRTTEIDRPSNDVSVPLTTIVGTSTVGSEVGSITIALTSVLATAAVGTLNIIKSIAFAGVLVTSAVGSIGFTESGNIGVTGIVGTSAVDSISQSRTVGLTGVIGTSAVDTVTVSLGVTKALTGVEGTSAIGTIIESHSGSVPLTNILGTGNVGSIGFTESGNVGLTGIEATSAVGIVDASSEAEATLTGNEVNGAVNSLVQSTKTSITGNASVGAVGSLTQGTRISITGVQGNSAIGAIGFTESGTVGLTGVVATSAIGTITESHSGSALLTSAVSTIAIGQPIQSTTIELTGVLGTSFVGTVAVQSGSVVVLIGVEAIGMVNNALIIEDLKSLIRTTIVEPEIRIHQIELENRTVTI